MDNRYFKCWTKLRSNPPEMAASEYSYIILELEWYFVIMLSKIYVPCVVLCKLSMAQYRILFLIKEENMCCCFRGHGSLGGSHGNDREDWGVWNDWGSVRSRVTKVSIGSNWFGWRYFNFAHVVMTYSLSSDICYMTTWMAHLRSICKANSEQPCHVCPLVYLPTWNSATPGQIFKTYHVWDFY